MDWPAAVPEKKTEKPFGGTNKFLLDLVTSGGAAAVVKTVFSANLASVARYAPSMALNFAFKEQYKNYILGGVDMNNSFTKLAFGNFLSGGAAGASALCIIHPLQNGFKRPAPLIPSVTLLQSALYFGLYDTLKVVVASDGERPNIFVATPLALATTFCTDLISTPFYLAGQILSNPDKHKDFLSSVDDLVKAITQPKKEGTKVEISIRLKKEDLSKKNGEVLSDEMATTRHINTDIFKQSIKKFVPRVATGAFVLVLFDEIQKWMH